MKNFTNEFLDLKNEDEIFNYITQNSYNFSTLEKIKFLAKGGESQIWRLKVLQPVEIVAKLPIV